MPKENLSYAGENPGGFTVPETMIPFGSPLGPRCYMILKGLGPRDYMILKGFEIETPVFKQQTCADSAISCQT